LGHAVGAKVGKAVSLGFFHAGNPELGKAFGIALSEGGPNLLFQYSR
jgi:hypothetical protein